jgi:hypothetical protein
MEAGYLLDDRAPADVAVEERQAQTRYPWIGAGGGPEHGGDVAG